jgi:hypothetical protein
VILQLVRVGLARRFFKVWAMSCVAFERRLEAFGILAYYFVNRGKRHAAGALELLRKPGFQFNPGAFFSP